MKKDPSSGTQSPVISQILSLFLLILLFSTNGHLLVFEAIYKSYDVLPKKRNLYIFLVILDYWKK